MDDNFSSSSPAIIRGHGGRPEKKTSHFSEALRALGGSKRHSVFHNVDGAPSVHKSLFKWAAEKERLFTERGAWIPDMSLLRKGCECSLFLLLPPLCQPDALPPPLPTQCSERLYPNKDRRPGDACMGGVGGGLVGELRGEGACGGVCVSGRGVCVGGCMSNLGVHFGVWKTVGLFQPECNISTEHASWRSGLWREGGHCQLRLFAIHALPESQDNNGIYSTKLYSKYIFRDTYRCHRSANSRGPMKVPTSCSRTLWHSSQPLDKHTTCGLLWFIAIWKEKLCWLAYKLVWNTLSIHKQTLTCDWLAQQNTFTPLLDTWKHTL